MSLTKVNKDVLRIEIAELIGKIKEHSDRLVGRKEIQQADVDVVLHLIEELHRKTVVWSYVNELPEESAQQPVVSTQSPVSGSTFVSPAPAMEPEVTPSSLEPAAQFHNHTTEELKRAFEETIPEIQVPPKGDIETKIGNEPKPGLDEQLPEMQLPSGDIEPKTENRSVKSTSDVPGTGNLRDIRSLIGFNEKLMYIRQVFRGNNVAYDEALSHLNNMKSYGEAEAYLAHLSEEFKWRKDFEPVEIFHQTVKRRFS